MNLKVVTGNPNKAKEVAAYFGDSVTIEHVKLDLPEYRGDDVGEIARGKAKAAYDAVGGPLIVDDTGFYIRALNGFPGAYAAFVLDTIGMDGVLRLMEGKPDRGAYFETAIAYADDEGIFVFKGRIEGAITTGPRGDEGFGYDPIFCVGEKTLAEISLAEKSAVSHRGKALEVFKKWFVENRL
jgi:XTP/dITP diphosphohydrolase